MKNQQAPYEFRSFSLGIISLMIESCYPHLFYSYLLNAQYVNNRPIFISPNRILKEILDTI